MTPEQEKELRQNFSKVLGAPSKYENEYGYQSKKVETVYSWEEIFCEVGKLLERSKVENVGVPMRYTTTTGDKLDGPYTIT